MSGPAVCAKCRHHARGRAIDMRPRRVQLTMLETRMIPSPPRPGLQGGNYICAREGLTDAAPDPVTGFVGLPSGPDCRDLNPGGQCEHYKRGATAPDAVAACFLFFGLVVAVQVVLVIAGVL